MTVASLIACRAGVLAVDLKLQLHVLKSSSLAQVFEFEFKSQGDRERALGLPISLLFDRNKCAKRRVV